MVVREIAKEQINQFREKLLKWYHQNGRKFSWREERATHYERIIAEILLQRTKAETIAAFMPRFLQAFPSWDELAKASEDDLKEFFLPIGLWKRRAASLAKLAREIHLRHGSFPTRREEIEALPGIGQYITNAILLLCYGEPQPLIDVNMSRVLERYFGPRYLVDIRYDPYIQRLAKAVVDGDDPASINWAILDLAALICKVKVPKCQICPLLGGCCRGQFGDKILQIVPKN